MLAFLGLLWTCEAVVTSYPVAKWEAHLKAIDGTLPLLVGADSKICYYVDVSQTCYQDAMSKFLGLTDLTGWTATAADCAKVLEGLRAYLESVLDVSSARPSSQLQEME